MGREGIIDMWQKTASVCVRNSRGEIKKEGVTEAEEKLVFYSKDALICYTSSRICMLS